MDLTAVTANSDMDSRRSLSDLAMPTRTPFRDGHTNMHSAHIPVPKRLSPHFSHLTVRFTRQSTDCYSSEGRHHCSWQRRVTAGFSHFPGLALVDRHTSTFQFSPEFLAMASRRLSSSVSNYSIWIKQKEVNCPASRPQPALPSKAAVILEPFRCACWSRRVCHRPGPSSAASASPWRGLASAPPAT